MSRVGELGRRIASMRTLDDAVSAMSSLSAHHLRQARLAAPLARSYRDELADALARAQVSLPGPGHGQTLLLVVGSQLGLCGGYNGRVADAAARRRETVGPGPTLAVGRRMANALQRRHVLVDEQLVGITSLDGVPALVLELATRALVAHRAQGLGAVELVAARFHGVGDDTPEPVPLLPLQLPRVEDPSWELRYTGTDRMAEEASRELLYVTLVMAITDAIAAEHAARLLATRAAAEWLDERVEKLSRQLTTLRQEIGTQETLEVAAAARMRRT